MCRGVVRRIVNMNESPVNDGHCLQDVGQDLAQVVAILQRRIGRQDNIHFDKELVAGVVCAQILNLADGCSEAHSQVEQEVALVRLRGEASQVADVVGRRLAPVDDDDEGQEEAAEGIQPPDAGVEAD